ncbi:sulfurtransferase TusA family protein [bacterium]|nr:sulfurtransferase TusA family protein [bacterium]
MCQEPLDVIYVDARELCCPMPLLRAKQALNKAAEGQLVNVSATDASSWRDFKVYADYIGCPLERFVDAGVYTYVFCKKENERLG